MSDEASKPIAEEMLNKPKPFRPKEFDRLRDYRDKRLNDDQEWVPEPPTY